MSRLEKVAKAVWAKWRLQCRELLPEWDRLESGFDIQKAAQIRKDQIELAQAALDAIDEGWTDAPAGMALVPREPTNTQEYDGVEAMNNSPVGRSEIGDVVAIYKAMLSAITPPKPEGE